MEQPKNYTLCELIDLIVGSIENEKTASLKSDFEMHVDLLSNRLEISHSASILFAFVFQKSVKGFFPTKYEVTSILPKESTRGIYMSIQELYLKEYVKSFRNNPRRPEICFYTQAELDKQIVNNIVPNTLENINSKNKSSINIRRIDQTCDYLIYFEEKELGTVYSFITEDVRYSAVVNSELIAQSNSMEEILKILNQLLNEHKLNIP